MKKGIAFLAVAACFFLLGPVLFSGAAIPDRPSELPELLPAVAGECNWGIITQDDRKIQIDGHGQWYVRHGEIRADGLLFVEWIFRADGELAPGIYHIRKDGSIDGNWNWNCEVTRNSDGTFDGMNESDVLRDPPNHLPE